MVNPATRYTVVQHDKNNRDLGKGASCSCAARGRVAL